MTPRVPITLYTGDPLPPAWWQDPLLWWCVLAALVAVFVAGAVLLVWRQNMMRRAGEVAFSRLARGVGLSRTQAAAVQIAADRAGVPSVAVLLSKGAAARVPGLDAVLTPSTRRAR